MSPLWLSPLCICHRSVFVTTLFVIGLEYKLEKQDEPGVAIDLDKPLSAMDTYDFCLVRENSKSNKIIFHGFTKNKKNKDRYTLLRRTIVI